MNRYPLVLAAGINCLSLVLWGCSRPQSTQKIEPLPGAHAVPVIQVGDDATAVVTKAVQALGRDKTFSRWKCGYVKYKATGAIIPIEGAEATMEETFQLPGHFKRVARFGIGDTVVNHTYVINNGKMWIKRQGEEARLAENSFADSTEHQFARFCTLSPLLEADTQLTKLGEDRIDNRPALVIRARFSNYPETDYYFDIETGLPRRTKKASSAGDANRAIFDEAFLDDYREVQGGMVPMRIRSFQGGKKMLDVAISDLKFHDSFDGSVFVKP